MWRTTTPGAVVRHGLAVDVHLHGRRFIVAEFTALAVFLAGLSVAIVAATLRRAAYGGVPAAGWVLAAVLLTVVIGWVVNCVAAARLARSLSPTPPDDINLWPLTARLLLALLIPFAASRH